MVVVKMADGLGNQIFRYVCGYSVAKKRGEQLALDIADYTSDTFRSFQMDNFALDDYRKVSFPNHTVVGKALRRIYRPTRFHVIHEQDENLYQDYKKDIYLNGYYEDLSFYRMNPGDIRRQLKPGYNMSKETLSAMDYCRNNKTCAVHLRLGDRRYDSTEYFRAAVEQIRSNSPESTFIIFSNEMDEARKILQPLDVEMKVVDEFGKFTDIDSFFILQSCHDQILSVGTYGIWAGILNDHEDKKVIVPKEVSDVPSYPGEWIRL